MDSLKQQQQQQQQNDEATECFICYDSFTEENTKATPNPCKCKGSIAIHLSCLKILMNHQDKCKSCNVIYNKMLYVNIYESIDMEFARKNFYYLEKIEQTQELCEYAFNYNKECFKAINDIFKTQIMCSIALENNDNNIRYIPKHIQTYEMVKPILTKSVRHIPYIKKEFIDSSLMTYYISKKEKSILKYFPKEFQTSSNCKEIIAYDGSQIDYVCNELKTIELEKLSLNTRTPCVMEFRTYSKEIQEKIVKQHWRKIEYMINPSNALCVNIIKKHPDAICLIKNPSNELISLALKLNWTLMYYLITADTKDFIYKKVIRILGNNIHHIVKYNNVNYINNLLLEMNIRKQVTKINDTFQLVQI